MSTPRLLSRQENIFQLLITQESATIKELSKKFGVSGWTIRRDLDEMEKMNLIQRFHGGVVISENIENPGTPDIKRKQTFEYYQETQKRIGFTTAKLIRAHQKVFISPGMTSTFVAQGLKNKKRISVYTNALNIAQELSNHSEINVVCTGGDAFGPSYSLTGTMTERAMRTHFYDIAIIDVDGIDIKKGLSCASPLNAFYQKIMIEQSHKTIIMADHSKWGRNCHAYVAPINVISTLVTDIHPATKIQDTLIDLGINMIVADDN